MNNIDYSTLDDLPKVPEAEIINNLEMKLCEASSNPDKFLALFVLDVEYFSDYYDYFGEVQRKVVTHRINNFLTDMQDQKLERNRILYYAKSDWGRFVGITEHLVLPESLKEAIDDEVYLLGDSKDTKLVVHENCEAHDGKKIRLDPQRISVRAGKVIFKPFEHKGNTAYLLNSVLAAQEEAREMPEKVCTYHL